MRISFTKEALADYANIPTKIQKSFDKQATFLMQDIRYPS
jgi:hypothetical protein